MSEQTELSCVSCDTTFDPQPTGGFCPDCDTPHPDFGHEEADEEAATQESEPAEEEAAAGGDTGAAEPEAEPAGPDFCPDCGFDLTGDLGAPADAVDSDLEACPSCGRSVTDESYCPDCGTDLDAERQQLGEPTDAGAPADTGEPEPPADEAGAPDEVTLVVNGSRYSFGDGDTFGRQDQGWLDDLIEAAGGKDDVSYISGEHMKFSFEEGGAFVVDISRNGTTLNDTDLDGGKAKINDGDTITLADRAEIDVEI